MFQWSLINFIETFSMEPDSSTCGPGLSSYKNMLICLKLSTLKSPFCSRADRFRCKLVKFMTTLKGTRLDSPKKMQNKDEKSGDDKSLTDLSNPLSAFCSKNTTYLAKLAILLQYSPHKMLTFTQVRNKCGVYSCCPYDKCKHPIWNTSFHFKAFHLMFL